MGPISKKVIDGLKKAKNRKIINFSEIKEANAYAQNKVSVLRKGFGYEKITIDMMQFHTVYELAVRQIMT